MNDDKELLDHVGRIRRKFKTVEEDHEENQLSYLDELNALIKKIFKDDPVDAYDVLSENGLQKWKKSKFKRGFYGAVKNLNLRNFGYFALLVTITGFLVHEALGFYSSGDVVTTKTWVKAILTEICFIFLSGYRTEGKLQLIWVNFLRASIFVLMVFVITSQTFLSGAKTVSESDVISIQITTIESQIVEKEKQMEYYLKKDWPRNYSSTRLEKEKLVNKLLELRQEQASGKNKDVSQIEKTRTYGRAAFRVLLLFISMLVTRRLFRF